MKKKLWVLMLLVILSVGCFVLAACSNAEELTPQTPPVDTSNPPVEDEMPLPDENTEDQVPSTPSSESPETGVE